MSITDEILQAIEEGRKAQQTDKWGQPVQQAPREKVVKKKTTFSKSGKLPGIAPEIAVKGYPVVYPPVKWGDIGLSMTRQMGFVPNKAVELRYKKGKWYLTGARASSALLLFMLAGAGGLIYVLQDVISRFEDWGWIMQLAIGIGLPLISVLIRNKTTEFMPYEMEMLALDAESNILIVSILTHPGGSVALKLDLPDDERRKKLELSRITSGLKKAHSGFSFINGMVELDTNKWKQATLKGLFGALLIYVYIRFLM